MDPFERYFTLNQKLLSFAGLSYTQPHKGRLLRYCVIGFMALYSVFGELCQIVTLNLDLRTAVRSLQVFIPAIAVSVLYSYAILNYMTLQQIFTYIKRDWQRLKDDNELKIMQKHSHITKLFTLSLGLLIYLYITISISPPLLRIIMTMNEIRSDIDHYPIISCIDYFSARRIYYYPIIMYQILATLVLCAVTVACFSMYFSFIQHACARLCIIKYKIHCPFTRNDHKDNFLLVHTDLTHWIIDIIQRLARTKEFMALVNSSTERCYVVLWFVGFILLIMDFLCMPALLERNENWKNVAEPFFFICGTLYLLYINCYIGQRLIDYSMDVYREAYNWIIANMYLENYYRCIVPIHELSLKTQKLLLTTLMISAKPCTFSVQQVYVASHVFFSSILRSSLSIAIWSYIHRRRFEH